MIYKFCNENCIFSFAFIADRFPFLDQFIYIFEDLLKLF